VLADVEKAGSTTDAEELRKELRTLQDELRQVRTWEALDASDRLLEVMRQRLLVMNDVAAWKWNHRVEVNDPERERQVLDALRARAKEKGLAPEAAVRFFAAQLDAARLLQQERIAAWQKDNTLALARGDLQKELRPRIDRLNDEMLDLLAQTLGNGPEVLAPVRDHVRQRAAQALAGLGINEAVRARATEGLASARP